MEHPTQPDTQNLPVDRRSRLRVVGRTGACCLGFEARRWRASHLNQRLMPWAARLPPPLVVPPDRNPSEHLKQREARAGPWGQRRNQRRRAATSLVNREPNPKCTASCGQRGLVTVAERPPRPAVVTTSSTSGGDVDR